MTRPASGRLRPAWWCEDCQDEQRYDNTREGRRERNLGAYRHKRDTGHAIGHGNRFEQFVSGRWR